MFRAIMDRLPPAAGPHAPLPARDVFVTSWFIFIPLALFFFLFFYISTLWIVQILSLGVFFILCAHLIFYYAFLFQLWFIFIHVFNLTNI
jgi:hypothetical protein